MLHGWQGMLKNPHTCQKKSGVVVWPCLTCWCFTQDTPHCTFPPWIELSKKNCYDDDHVLLSSLNSYMVTGIYPCTVSLFFYIFFTLLLYVLNRSLKKFYVSIALPLHNMCILTLTGKPCLMQREQCISILSGRR